MNLPLRTKGPCFETTLIAPDNKTSLSLPLLIDPITFLHVFYVLSQHIEVYAIFWGVHDASSGLLNFQCHENCCRMAAYRERSHCGDVTALASLGLDDEYTTSACGRALLDGVTGINESVQAQIGRAHV